MPLGYGKMCAPIELQRSCLLRRNVALGDARLSFLRIRRSHWWPRG